MTASRTNVSLLVMLGVFLVACEAPGNEKEDSSSAAAEAADSTATSVDLYPSDASYSLVRLDIGALAFAWDTIVATPSGSEVRLQVGNTTNAGLEGLSANVAWGSIGRGMEPQVEPSRTRQVELVKVAAAGKWTAISFTLDGVAPADVQFLRLFEIDYTGLVLK